MAQPKFSAVTNPTPNSVVDARVKPNAELQLLIGGPYTQDGEEHRYGHTALRVKTARNDVTYDFGRYGEITGTFHDGGEGILRVWTNFNSYIRGENMLKRVTTAFVYSVFAEQANAVTDEAALMMRAGKPRPDLERGRDGLKVYRLNTPYVALSNNCTTLSMDLIKRGIPHIDKGSQKFIKPDLVMSWSERAAMNSVGGGTPGRIFLPANLREFLSTKPSIKVDRIDTYGGK